MNGVFINSSIRIQIMAHVLCLFILNCSYENTIYNKNVFRFCFASCSFLLHIFTLNTKNATPLSLLFHFLNSFSQNICKLYFYCLLPFISIFLTFTRMPVIIIIFSLQMVHGLVKENVDFQIFIHQCPFKI